MFHPMKAMVITETPNNRKGPSDFTVENTFIQLHSRKLSNQDPSCNEQSGCIFLLRVDNDNNATFCSWNLAPEQG
ncbi:hypothetical protein BS17DRAFT_18925 [Gyrodon lividus]|nr:hypothetical protein BS17DRAFT_18925 [Gyrodon lividus]